VSVLSVPEIGPLTEMASAMIFPFVSVPFFTELQTYEASKLSVPS
jgi:hypothetical protein